MSWWLDEVPDSLLDGVSTFDPFFDDRLALPVADEPVANVLRDHGVRLERLEAHVFREQVAVATTESTPPVATASAPAVAPIACPVAGCGNRTGLLQQESRHLAKHIASRTHVESALALGSPDQLRLGLGFCGCGEQGSGVTERTVMVDIAKCLGARRFEVASHFERLAAVPFCAHIACLRVRRTSADSALLEARERAAEALADAFNDDGTRKRRRDRLRGDRAVALALGEAPFASPGVCYVFYDTTANQLRVQQALPADPAQTAFHVAHVARAHRWEHIVHFDDQTHTLWQSHVPVAEVGFVDTFVVVDARVQTSLHVDVGVCQLDGPTRQLLFNNITSGDWLLCAGRSDGWLELRCCDDVGNLIALPLSHLQLHSARVYDRDAPPSLLLASEGRAASLTSSDARALQHFHPAAVEPAKLKLEMLCRCSGWHLVRPGGATSTDARLAQALADVEALQRENARLREQIARRGDAQADVTLAPSALRSKAEVEAWMRETGRRFCFYQSSTGDEVLVLCVRTASAFVHCKIKRTKSGGFLCAREVHANSLSALVTKLNLDSI